MVGDTPGTASFLNLPVFAAGFGGFLILSGSSQWGFCAKFTDEAIHFYAVYFLAQYDTIRYCFCPLLFYVVLQFGLPVL